MKDENGEPLWVTRDKRVLRIKDMTDEHLANTIRFLRVRGYCTPGEIEISPLATMRKGIRSKPPIRATCS